MGNKGSGDVCSAKLSREHLTHLAPWHKTCHNKSKIYKYFRVRANVKCRNMCAGDDVLVQMVMIVPKAGRDKDRNVADFDGDAVEDDVHEKVPVDTPITCL